MYPKWPDDGELWLAFGLVVLGAFLAGGLLAVMLV